MEYIRGKPLMRTNLLHRWFLLPLLGLGAFAALANEQSNVRIEFVHPERFSDLQIQGRQEITSAPIFRERHLCLSLSPTWPDASPVPR